MVWCGADTVGLGQRVAEVACYCCCGMRDGLRGWQDGGRECAWVGTKGEVGGMMDLMYGSDMARCSVRDLIVVLMHRCMKKAGRLEDCFCCLGATFADHLMALN